MVGVIVNPISGGGQSAGLTKRIERMIEQRGQTCRLFETTAESDGGAQARLALESGCGAVVCIGGDGTLSEVVQVIAGSGCVLYIVPCGTGNDFARAFGLPRDPVAAFRAQLDGVRTKIDCGSVNGRPFINVSGSGLDVEVLRKTEALKQVYPGEKAYRKAVLAVLGSYRAFEAELSVDGGAFVPCRSTIVEVANGQYIGGGMRVAPTARLQDGLLDVVQVGCVPRRLISLLLPLFILGWHVRLPIARVVRAKRATVRARGMVVNIDGRLERMDEARFAVMPAALDMMKPRK